MPVVFDGHDCLVVADKLFDVRAAGDIFVVVRFSTFLRDST